MVFNLYAIEGYKHQEIAELLGINEGTSKSQLSHARKMLQTNITKLKITTMAPNKIENQIKEQLNAREIQPTEMAWDRLDSMLSVAEAKSAKRSPFFSYRFIGIAASFLVFLSIGILYLNQKIQKLNLKIMW